MLSNEDLQRIETFYRDAIEQFGSESARSVHWSSREGQLRRFDILLTIADMEHASVLDVGCGLGDMYEALKERYPHASYKGIDIIPEFIEKARERYPEAHFELKDVFEEEEMFDYVVASGALSFKVQDNEAYYMNMVRKMYFLARKGVSFNMLRSDEHVDNETYATYNPASISEFCSTFAERIEVVTDYLPQDFTVYLHRE